MKTLLSLTICFLLLAPAANARTLVSQDVSYEINEQYSFKDFTGQDLSQEEISGVVFRSCLSQMKPDTTVFNPNMTGVTFVDCNLDNVVIPPGNTVVGGTHRRYLIDADGVAWEIDQDDKPLKVLGAE